MFKHNKEQIKKLIEEAKKDSVPIENLSFCCFDITEVQVLEDRSIEQLLRDYDHKFIDDIRKNPYCFYPTSYDKDDDGDIHVPLYNKEWGRVFWNHCFGSGFDYLKFTYKAFSKLGEDQFEFEF